MLWRLSEGDATVYLLGSIHVATPDFYPLAPSIESAFAEAGALAFEIDLSPSAQADAVQQVQALGMYPQGETIWAALSPQTAGLLRQRAAEVGLPLQVAERMRPWMVAVALTMATYAEAGLQTELGIDQHLYGRAQQAGKKLHAIETPRAQLEALGGHPRAVQELMLREALEGLDDAGDGIDLLAELWLSGDAQGLGEEIHRSIARPEYTDLYRALFTDRNAVMAEAVRGYLRAGGTTLVVVGSGHLVGRGSVVELLEATHPVVQLRGGRGVAAEDEDG